MPRVLTAVLNHRTAAETLQCVAALRQSTMRDQIVVVVDNASDDGSAEALREGLPTTVVEELEDNLGYAGGNNQALGLALELGCDFAWVVNPDCLVEADTLARLVAEAHRHPEAGLFGPRLIQGGSRPPTIQSDGGLVAEDGASSHLHAGRPVSETPATSRRVDFVSGSCLLVRCSMAREIGLLPEEYFLYFEETDYALRAAEAGWESRVDSTAIAHHFRISATTLPTPTYVYYYVRGQARFGQRWCGLDPAHTLDRLGPWYEGWRARVGERASHRLDDFDRLVRTAIDDAVAGVEGRRDDVHDMVLT